MAARSLRRPIAQAESLALQWSTHHPNVLGHFSYCWCRLQHAL